MYREIRVMFPHVEASDDDEMKREEKKGDQENAFYLICAALTPCAHNRTNNQMRATTPRRINSEEARVKLV